MGPTGMRLGSEKGFTQETNSFYHSRNIVSVIKSRRLRCARCVDRMEENRTDFKILTDLKEGLNVDARKIECILKKDVSIRGIGLIRPRIGIIEEPL